MGEFLQETNRLIEIIVVGANIIGIVGLLALCLLIAWVNRNAQ